MVQVVVGGNTEFNALVYGQKNPGTISFLEREAFTVSPHLTAAGAQFFANQAALFEQYNGAEALRLAAAAVKKVGSIFQPNSIRALLTVPEIQNAPLAMQRWIMAEPTIRELYHQQRCDGFADTYVDMHPGFVGREHYDWRQVQHGMVQTEDEEAPLATFYFDELAEGDRELTLDEKMDIVSTWEVVKLNAKAGKADPTSAYGTEL
ncbi:hypothetical protein D3C71_79010 [compost metagenome]